MSQRAGLQPTPEQAKQIRDGLRRRETTRDPDGMRGLHRIEIAVSGVLAYEARDASEGEAVMVLSEPPKRGGAGGGSSPLAAFLAGAGSCLLHQFVRITIAEGYPVRFVTAMVRGEFRREPGGKFQRIRFEIHAEGNVAGVPLDSLAERAELLCYAHNTLRPSVEMTTRLHLNGEVVHERHSRPGS